MRAWWAKQAERRMLRAASRSLSPKDQDLGHPRLAVERGGWRSRVVAAMQLILYVVLMSALVAGAMAAVALKVGHFRL
jgi:hypothetical protein